MIWKVLAAAPNVEDFEDRLWLFSSKRAATEFYDAIRGRYEVVIEPWRAVVYRSATVALRVLDQDDVK